jgi:solute carrier family 25 citrate transporter 1
MDLNIVYNKGNVMKNEHLYSITSGSIAGALEILTLWPFEYIKTKLQLYPRHPKFHNIRTCANYTIQNKGYLGLYTGITPILTSNIINVGIRFGGYTHFSNYFRNNNDGILLPKHVFYSGALTGCIEAILVATPIETIKTKLITKDIPTITGVKNIYHTFGIRGLYQGFVPTLMKSVSSRGMQFYLFEKYRIMLEKDYNISSLTATHSFIGGMGAGLISTVVNNPVDVLKTQMQKDSHINQTSIQIIQQLYRTGGIPIFYTGILPRLINIVPAQGIIFMSYYYIYDIVKQVYGVQ